MAVVGLSQQFKNLKTGTLDAWMLFLKLKNFDINILGEKKN
jgi:hypothetical protein